MPAVKIPQLLIYQNGEWVEWQAPPPPGGSTVRWRGLSVDDGGPGPGPGPDTFVLGYDRPDGAGIVPTFADGQLPVYSGPAADANGTVTVTSGMNLQNVEIRGHVKWAAGATGYQFKRVRVVAPDRRNFVQSALVDATNAGAGLLEQFEVTAYANNKDNSRFWLNGLNLGSAVTASRFNIHDVNDGITARGNNWKILGGWVHDLAYRSDDTDHSGDTWPWPSGSHNDGIQFGASGCTGYLIEGMFFDVSLSQISGMIGDPNAPSILANGTVVAGNNGHIDPGADWYPNTHGALYQAKNGLLSGMTRRCWFRYGTYAIQANASNPTTGNAVQFDGNRVYVSQSRLNSAPTDSHAGALQITATRSMNTDAFASLFGTTVYAPDDPGVSADWRGHAVQSSPSSGNSKYDPTLIPA